MEDFLYGFFKTTGMCTPIVFANVCGYTKLHSGHLAELVQFLYIVVSSVVPILVVVMSKIASIILVLLLFAGCGAQKQVALHLIGDSTCAQKTEGARPETGWGEKFNACFDKKVVVRNYAMNGRSTRTFIEENRWDSVYSAIRKGDYVFIQFGHNDEVKEKASYTTPDEFAANLRRFVDDTRAKGGYPVLLTPVCRRRFEEENFYDTHGKYASITRQVAKQTDALLVDMHTLSMAILVQWGEEESARLFMQLAPGEYPNYPNGRDDNTHFNGLGATVMAEAVAKSIAHSAVPLKRRVVKSLRSK